MPEAATDQDLARLESNIAALRDDIAHIVATLGDLRQTSAETLRASLAAKADSLRTEGNAHIADLRQTAEAQLAALSDHARRNPVQTMLVAGGLGLLLGLLIGRR